MPHVRARCPFHGRVLNQVHKIQFSSEAKLCRNIFAGTAVKKYFSQLELNRRKHQRTEYYIVAIDPPEYVFILSQQYLSGNGRSHPVYIL